jgi:hypothetical protein
LRPGTHPAGDFAYPRRSGRRPRAYPADGPGRSHAAPTQAGGPPGNLQRCGQQREGQLLFALARDAKLQIDIDPNLTGVVTLNAIDQTLPQILTRLARQVDLRWEVDGDNLVVLRDSPYLRSYRIDYLGAGRNVKMSSSSSTQFAATAAGTSQTGAVAVVDVNAVNTLWDSVVHNVKEILQETPARRRSDTRRCAPIHAAAAAAVDRARLPGGFLGDRQP